MTTTQRERIAETDLLIRPGTGTHPPLILLHGIGSNAEGWAPVLANLPPHIHAIAWDAPGYGTSVPLDTPHPIPADYAPRLLTIIDTLQFPTICLAGHSLGTLFASAFAARYPDRVAALALFSPALGHQADPGQPLPPIAQVRIDDFERLGPIEFAIQRAPKVVYQAETKPQVVALMRQAMQALNPAGYVQAVWALATGNQLADIPNIACPTIVAVGTEDTVTPPAQSRQLFGALRHGLKLLEVPNTAHSLPQEEPALVAQLLTELVC
jgi:pimeloyl-ACP methyl ester carboxylesterase